MRLKKLLVALAAVSIVHFSGFRSACSFAQQATGPFGNAAQAAGRADHLGDGTGSRGFAERRLQSVCQATFPSIVSFGSSDSAAAGVIVALEGLILTQAHVIGDLKAGSKLWPTLHTPHNDTAAEAEIVRAALSPRPCPAPAGEARALSVHSARRAQSGAPEPPY